MVASRQRKGAFARGIAASCNSAARGLLLTLGLSLGACANGPNLSADYGQTARENYELAVGEFADKDWEESIAFADFVRIRFPFSRYAVEAELLIARAQFELGEHVAAKDAFKQFQKLHPTHKHVRNGWVAYMVAVSAYMAGPDDFFIMPPHYQRDQSMLQDALVELAFFFDHYSDSPLEPLAAKLRETVQRKLLEHELYVAEFYLDRDRPEAAIGRLEAAHRRYPGIGFDAEVLFLLGVTYLRMEEIELARSTFSELQTQHPGHHHGKQAKLYLRHIFDNYGPADPNRVRPDRSRPVPITPPQPKNIPGRKKAKDADDAEKKKPTPTPLEPATEPAEPAGTPASEPKEPA
jgi:outer membrane protein assembly factor BamD